MEKFTPHTAPSVTDIEEMAHTCIAQLPGEMAEYVAGIIIRVDEFPAREVLDELGGESDYDLLGLYSGQPGPDKSIIDTPGDVDMIFLYRRPLLDYWCESGEDLMHLVRHVIIHEIGHHFGFSDEDMERIEGAPHS